MNVKIRTDALKDRQYAIYFYGNKKIRIGRRYTKINDEIAKDIMQKQPHNYYVPELDGISYSKEKPKDFNTVEGSVEAENTEKKSTKIKSKKKTSKSKKKSYKKK